MSLVRTGIQRARFYDLLLHRSVILTAIIMLSVRRWKHVSTIRSRFTTLAQVMHKVKLNSLRQCCDSGPINGFGFTLKLCESSSESS